MGNANHLALAVVAALAVAAPASATNLIVNGDFETGDFSGWTLVNTGTSGNSFYNIANGANVPASGHPTSTNPTGGSRVAVSDQYGPGGATLSQSFTTSGGLISLSFDWFNNTHNPYLGNAIDGSAQSGRVDIMFDGAGAFDVGAGVALNILLNAGSYTNFGTTIPWQSYAGSFVLPAGTYTLRFGEGECCYYQQFGVDNVSLSVGGVPEPATWAMLIAGFGLVGAAARRRRSVVA